MPEVRARENVLLRPFDVDLEKMHLAPHELGPQVLQRAHIHPRLDDLEARREMTLRDVMAQRRESAVPNLEKVALACARSQRHAQTYIARTRASEFFVIDRNRFYVDARPPALVESARDGMRVRVLRPDIDIGACLDSLQCVPQAQVLVVLRVGYEAAGGRARRTTLLFLEPRGRSHCLATHLGVSGY